MAELKDKNTDLNANNLQDVDEVINELVEKEILTSTPNLSRLGFCDRGPKAKLSFYDYDVLGLAFGPRRNPPPTFQELSYAAR